MSSIRGKAPRRKPAQVRVGAFETLRALTATIKKEISDGTFGFGRKTGTGLDLLNSSAKDLVAKLNQLREDAGSWQLVSATTPQRLDYLRALAWCADCFDYFGRSGVISGETPTKLIEEEASRIRERLDHSRLAGELDRKMAREEVWVLLHNEVNPWSETRS